MIDLRMTIVGVKQIAARWFRKSATLPVEVAAVRQRNAQILLARVRARASGRPGPRVVTGAYRASWHIENEANASIVTTGAPQAMRLEYGFVGQDALGRNYSQPPFPHANPAADEIEGAYMTDMMRVVVDGI